MTMVDVIGRAVIEVVPDFSQFRSQVQQQVQQITANMSREFASKDVAKPMADSVEKAAKKANDALKEVGGKDVWDRLTNGADRAGEGITKHLKEAGTQSENALGQIGGKDLWGKLVAGASVAASKIEGYFKKSSNDAERAVGGLAGAMNNPGFSLKNLALGAGVIGTATIGFYKLKGAVQESVAAYQESRKIGLITEQLIKTTGGVAKVTAKDIAELATRTSNKTGIDDEQIQTGLNIILTFKKVRNEIGENNQIIDRAAAAAADLSTVMGTSMTGASMQLARALEDPERGVNSLRRSGVSFTKQQREQIKALVASGKQLEAQKLILTEVESQVGGTAAASIDPLEKLKVITGNLKEAFGAGLFPVVGKFAESFGNLVTSITPQMEELGEILGNAFVPLFDLIAPLVKTLIGAFGGLIQGITPGLEVLAETFTNVFKTAGPAIIDVFSTIGTAIGSFLPVLAPVLEAFGVLVKAILPPLSMLIKIVGDILLTAFEPVFSRLGPMVEKVGAAIGDSLGKALEASAPLFETMAVTLSKVLVALAPLIPKLLELGGSVLASLVQVLPTIANAFLLVVNAVAPLVPTLVNLLVNAILPLLPLLVNSLAPVLPSLANAFVQIVQALLPLVPVMVSLLVNVVIPLVPQLVTLVVQFVNLLTQTKLLTPVVVGLVAAFVGFKAVTAVTAGVGKLSVAMKAFTATTGFAKTAMAGYRGTLVATQATAATTKAQLIALKVGIAAKTVATKVATAAQWLWNAALNANPIGLIVAAVAALAGAVILAYKKIGPFRDLMDSIGRWFRDTLWPVIKQVAGVIGGALKSAFNAVLPVLQAVWNIFKGLYIQPVIDAFKVLAKLFTGDFKGALEGVKNLFGNLGDTFGNMGDLAGKLISGLWGALKTVGAWLLSTGLPFLGRTFVTLVSKIPGFLGNLGSLLWGAMKAAFQWIVDNGPAILDVLKTWFVTIPAKLVGFLVGFAGKLLGWALDAFGWIVTNGAKIIANLGAWLVTLPFKMIAFLINFGAQLVQWATSAFGWIVTNAGPILAAVLGWFASLPGKFVSLLASLGSLLWNWLKSAFDWLVTNGPTLLMGFMGFVASIPGRILSGLGSLGSTLWGWLKGAFDYVVKMAPVAISGLVNFFSSLPGRLFDAMGAAISGVGKLAGKIGDIGAKIWESVKGFIRSKVLVPIADTKILGGKPFDFVRRLLADGDIITGPTQAIIGEAGPEVVVPLSDTRTLSNFVAGRAKFTSGVVNTPTPVTLGRRPEVVLPLSRPQRALSLAAKALGMARTSRRDGTAMGLAPTQGATTGSGRLLLGDGKIIFGKGIFGRSSATPVKIKSMEEIAPPKSFVEAMKYLGTLGKVIKDAGIPSTDMGMQGGSFAPRTKEQQLKFIKAMLDAGYRGTIYEDGSATLKKKGAKPFSLGGSLGSGEAPFTRAFLSENAMGKFIGQMERVHDFFVAVNVLSGKGTSILPKGDGLKVRNKEARKALKEAGFDVNYQPIVTSLDKKTKTGGFWRLGTTKATKDGLQPDDPFTLLTALPIMRAMAVQMVMRTKEITAKNFAEKFNELPRIVQNQLAARPYEPSIVQYPALLQAALLERVGRFAAFANGGVVTDATMSLIGEAGPEVVIPLTRPARAAQLVRESGLVSTVARADEGTATALEDGGILGGGPGNTYNIYGVSMSQVEAEIRARDEATVRVRR